MGQTVGGNTTDFALDVLGLPEVIQTSEGNSYLHLPGVIVAESAAGEVRYLLSDGLGSVRQAVDETGTVVSSHEFDPYGNPVDNGGGEAYGYTGEWWEEDVGLLHLRARWYAPETGTFLSRDPVESEPPYLYVRGNPVNLTDPRGTFPEALLRDAFDDRWVEYWKRQDKWWWNRMLEAEHGDAVFLNYGPVIQFVLDDPLLSAYPETVWKWDILPGGECWNFPTKGKGMIRMERFDEGRISIAYPPGWLNGSEANTYRLTTESFWHTGLHPNDPTWREFMSQHPGLSRYAAYSWHNEPTIWWLYYASLQARTSHLAQHFATTLDAAATVRSLAQAAAVDTMGAVLIKFGCAGGSGGGPGGIVVGCATGGVAAGAVDVWISAMLSPLDVGLGAGSLFSTAVSDYTGGYTIFANGRTRIGEATVHSSITLLEGFVPESNFQLYTNIKQLLHDFGIDSHVDTGVYDVKAIEIK